MGFSSGAASVLLCREHSTLWYPVDCVDAAHPHLTGLTGERNGDTSGLLDSHSQLWLEPRVPAPDHPLELTDGFLSEGPDVPGWPLSTDSR